MAMEPARARSRSDQLWQLPVFLIGAAALLAVWYARPHWQPTPAERLQRNIQDLRAALESWQTPSDRIEAALNRVGKLDPEKLDDATRALLGDAWLRVGEAGESPEKEAAAYALSKEMLSRVRVSDLPTEQAKRLAFRVARLNSHLKEGDPAGLLSQLAAFMPADEERIEGLRTVAGLYQRLQPPQDAKARDAWRDYLKGAPPRTRPAALAAARMELGTLQLKLNEADEARKTLERIGPDAPPEIFAAARVQLARSILKEGDWSQALRYLEQARDGEGAGPDVKARIRYETANVYLRSNRKDEALAILEELKKTDNPASAAASLKLVLLEGIDTASVERLLVELEKTSADMKPADGASELFSRNDIREICDQTYTTLLSEKKFEQAERAAKLYSKLAEPGRDKLALAGTYRAWADASGGEKASELRRKAADELAAAAATPNATSAQKRDLLMQAVELDSLAGDNGSALNRFDVYVSSVGGADKLDAAMWLRKGRLHLAARDNRAAITALEAGLNNAGAVEPDLRIELAEALIRESRSKEAIAQLEQALKLPKLKAETKLRENALYSLGDAYFQMREWTKAIDCFTQAVAYHSESSRAVSSRFHVGKAYWFLAGSLVKDIEAQRVAMAATDAPEKERDEAKRKHDAFMRQYRDHLLNAQKALDEVEIKLEGTEAAKDTTTPLGGTWRSAAFTAAKCTMVLGDYEKGIKRYERLAEKFPGKVDQLIALAEIHQACLYLQQPERAKQALTELRTVYSLKAIDYDSLAENRTKAYWDEWMRKNQ